MSTVRDTIPRSTMTVAQQRRIGALQVAKSLLVSNSYGGIPEGQVHLALQLAEFIIEEKS